MNLSNLISPGFLGLIFIIIFVDLMIYFAVAGRKGAQVNLRKIPAFSALRRSIGLAVEAGQRLHMSLGHGGISGVRGA